MIPNVLELARLFVASARPEGGVALDGTVGNGHDTLFLAQLVGEDGHVFGFDIQEAALTATGARLQAGQLRDRVTLFQADHARIGELIPEETALHAAMFNLGYLPHGDKAIITSTGSTLAALGGTIERLQSGGVLTVVLYPGHTGGDEEAQAVLAWARGLPRERAEVGWYQPWNARNPAPSLLVIGKR